MRLLASHSWVMPSLVPSRPLTVRSVLVALIVDSSELDLDIDTCRQIEPHQRVDGLGSGVDDVDQTLVRPHLKVLPTVLVLMRGADHTEDVLLRGQWHRPGDLRARTRHCVDDLARRRVNDLVVVGLQPDADLLSRHRLSFFSSFCVLLAHGPTYPWAPTPVVGRVGQCWRTTPLTCVLRRWPGPGPGVQATEQSRISRCGEC